MINTGNSSSSCSKLKYSQHHLCWLIMYLYFAFVQSVVCLGMLSQRIRKDYTTELTASIIMLHDYEM